MIQALPRFQAARHESMRTRVLTGDRYLEFSRPIFGLSLLIRASMFKRLYTGAWRRAFTRYTLVCGLPAFLRMNITTTVDDQMQHESVELTGCRPAVGNHDVENAFAVDTEAATGRQLRAVDNASTDLCTPENLHLHANGNEKTRNQAEKRAQEGSSRKRPHASARSCRSGSNLNP